jgi:hypothetical protein
MGTTHPSAAPLGQECLDPDAMRIQARSLYACARSLLDQAVDRTALRREEERLAGLALDLRRAVVALADAAERRAGLALPGHISWREEHLVRAAACTLGQLRQLYRHMAGLDRAAMDMQHGEARGAQAHG